MQGSSAFKRFKAFHFFDPLSATAKQQPLYTMETRLCSSGVQTDLTASSLAQSLSLSSSLSSSENENVNNHYLNVATLLLIDGVKSALYNNAQNLLLQRLLLLM
ncbi:hypothetical protein EVAR_71919_1 [Eumeta japonica]|uniref:Uncharacterized protein n=1 Tax=Eumeta variegata TaxID=151549 RepID=A0A4C1T9U3_EUMVA|nr:hypothetical protein EVAR_71919_1 [Eumeta japonica]